MLTALLAGLRGLKRPAMLVFFGDHRRAYRAPQLRAATVTTPYVMMRIDAAGAIISGENYQRRPDPGGAPPRQLLDANPGRAGLD
jgi:hypothetical protein